MTLLNHWDIKSIIKESSICGNCFQAYGSFPFMGKFQLHYNTVRWLLWCCHHFAVADFWDYPTCYWFLCKWFYCPVCITSWYIYFLLFHNQRMKIFPQSYPQSFMFFSWRNKLIVRLKWNNETKNILSNISDILLLADPKSIL